MEQVHKIVILVFIAISVPFILFPPESVQVLAEASQTTEVWTFSFSSHLPYLCLAGDYLEIIYLDPDYPPPQPHFEACIDLEEIPDVDPNLAELWQQWGTPIQDVVVEVLRMHETDQISSHFSFTHSITGHVISANLSGTIVDDEVTFTIVYHLPIELQSYTRPLIISNQMTEGNGTIIYSLRPELQATFQGNITSSGSSAETKIEGVFTTNVDYQFASLHCHEKQYTYPDHELRLEGRFELRFSNLELHGDFVVNGGVPVILVHGWHGAPKTWETLAWALDSKGIEHHIFSYEATGNPQDHANELKHWIQKLRANISYAGKFDIICHSMGALVSRWYMEVLGGSESIRQWIGIAPVNHGAALADFAVRAPISWLKLIFPDLSEEAVVHMNTESPTVEELRKRNDYRINSEVIYRVIVGINTDPRRRFNTLMGGKTLAKCDCERSKPYYRTYLGDGVVAMEQSLLIGAGVDCFPGVTHNQAPHDPDVIESIMKYLEDPSESSASNCPAEDPQAHDHFVIGTDNRGILYKGEYKSIAFLVDSSVTKATITTAWSGSVLNVTLTSPDGGVMEPGVSPVVEYWEMNNSIGYVIDLPEPGVWSARLDAIDVPEEGEPYVFMTLYSSSLILELTTSESKYVYFTGENATIVATIAEGDVPIIEALATTEIRRSDGSTVSLVLYDDGSHGDASAGDGSYVNVYSFPMQGTYSVVVYANGSTSEAFERMGFMPLWIVSEDTVSPNILDVSQFPSDITVEPDDAVIINSTVIDALSGVKQVFLNYTSDNRTWITVNMTNLEGDMWNATIPAFPLGTDVMYTIIAQDNAGNTIYSESIGYELQYQVIPEFPSLVILLLFMTLSLLAIFVHTRTHTHTCRNGYT